MLPDKGHTAKKSAAPAATKGRKHHTPRTTRKAAPPRAELPVTLLSGFLGSGKTSLLRHVLHHRHGLRVAVILNEISEINRAAMAIDPKAKDEKEDQSIGELLIQQIEFANVVVLNKLDIVTGEDTLEGALSPAHGAAIGELKGLVRSINPTALIVPATQCAIAVREVLASCRFSEDWAKGVAGWMEDIESGITHTPETLEYGIGSFLYTADRPFHPQRLHDWVDRLYFWNEIAFEDLDAPQEGDEEDDDDEDADDDDGAACAASPPQHHEAVPQKPDRSVSTDIAPMNAEGFQEFGAKEKLVRDAAYGNFFRSKGFIWLGNPDRVDHVMEWSQAGTVLNLQYSSTWDNFSTQIRGQRLVFIGQGIKKDELKRDLDELLLTEEEWGKLQRGEYNETPLPDPFEPFPVAIDNGDDNHHDHDHHHHHHHHHDHASGAACSLQNQKNSRKRSRD
ncbi:cobalamin biosynthesis protein, putative [Bodo saltans]|uniref:Cobalamin biosynthesis protein, putative n=1 Tax=Bodo saltans TaxID=75058 RepID=A0A0S4JDM3_BODSA|nr:cobalamin biosynthesis protein, putative [Bodo saltans]|eukprot:CUG88553.1 cobalamin biosynthesis protein, putative [Bodo saltans]